MRKLFIVIGVMILTACAGRRPIGSPFPPDLIHAEDAYLKKGDLSAAEAGLLKTLEDGPDVRAAFLLADLYDETGRPDQAIDYYFEALTTAHDSGEAPAAAIAAAAGVVAIRERVEGFYARFVSFMAEQVRNAGKLPLEAWYQLLNLKFGLLRSQGESGPAESARDAIGCLTRWQAVGPFGPWVWEGFDKETPLLASRPWPRRVSLGPGREETSPREVTADTCFVALDNPALPLEGVTYARTVVSTKKAGPVFLRLQTGDAVSLRVANKEILHRDTRKAFLSNVMWTEVELPEGTSEITLKFAGVSATPSFSLSVFSTDGTPGCETAGAFEGGMATGPLVTLPKDAPLPSPGWAPPPDGALTDAYAAMKVALWWDDMDLADQFFRRFAKGKKSSSPMALVNLAERVAADPALPSNLAYEQARPYLEKALLIEPRLWQARVGLAYRELDEDRMLPAISLLEEGLSYCPKEVSIPRKLAETFLGYGWYVEAEKSVEHIASLLPTSCNTYAWQLALLRHRSRFEEAGHLADKIATCNTFTNTVLQELNRGNKFGKSMAEAHRLARLEPENVSRKLDAAAAAEAVGDGNTALDFTRQALALSPLDGDVRISVSDMLSAMGDGPQARDALVQALDLPLGPRPHILHGLAALDGGQILAPYRVDGLAVIEEYKQSGLGEAYDNAAVYVMDRAVYDVDAHGSMVMIIHMITHLKTDEAVEDHGELEIPDGARLLTARTVKADGRILEPEEVAGKQTLSMPDLEPGDFIEQEYILYAFPNQLFPGGFDSGRFFFQDFDTAFHRTEIIVMVPKDVPLAFDPRGPCPPLKETEAEGKRILTWRTRNAAPYPSEPLSPNATEFLPSIRITAKAGWNALFKRINDQLADKDKGSHVMAEAVAEAVRGVDPGDLDAKRRAIYRWVVAHIEPVQEMLGQASHIIAERTGSRARAFAAMLRFAGLFARLVLVKAAGEDETPKPVPSIQLFSNLLVDVGKGELIDLSSEYAPYGFLPSELRHRPARYVDSGALFHTGGGGVPHDTQYVVMAMTLQADGSAVGRITETMTGSLAAGWRSGLEKNHEREQKRIFQGAYLAAAIPGAVLKQLRIKGQKDAEAPLVFQYDVVIPDFGRTRGNSTRVELPFVTNLGKQAGGLPLRETDLVMGVHIEKRVDASIVLPKGEILLKGSENDAHRTTEWGAFSRYERFADGKVELGYQTQLDVDRVSPDAYQRFLTFARHVDEHSQLTMRVGAAH